MTSGARRQRTRRFRAAWLRLVSRRLNRVTAGAARRGRGPFTLIEHTGRRTGRTYQTPVIVGRAEGGFVVELTYGTQVQWYRNVLAAGGCTVVRGDERWAVGAPRLMDARSGRAAFPAPARVVLWLLRRREFRFLPRV